MKKLLLILWVLSCTNFVMAQEEWTEDQYQKNNLSMNSKDNKNVVAFADKTTGIIQITVPKKMRIADKIFVENNSTYNIDQMAIKADYNLNEEYVSVVSLSSIPIGVKKVAAESDGDFRSLRGTPLKIRIKGSRPNSEEASYNFNVTLYEKDHDLYIKIGSNDDAFDF